MRAFKRIPSLKALHAFESAARHCSFTRAAAELSLSQGAISYQVKQLEAGLGAPLFHRHTRRVELTRAGRSLFRAVNRIFHDLEDEISTIFPQPADARLSVAVSTYFVTRWLSPRLGKFLNSHHGFTLQIQHSVNDPNFSLEDIDLAIRWGDGRFPGSESELLLEMPMFAVCAPALIERAGGLNRPQDLLQQTLLRDQEDIDYWPEWLRTAGLTATEFADTPVIVDPNVRVQAAVDGHGLVLANPLVQAEIDAGWLVEPFDVRLQGYGYYLIWSRQTVQGEALQLFRRWLRGEVANFLEQGGPEARGIRPATADAG